MPGLGSAQREACIGRARLAELLLAVGQALAGAGDEGQQLVRGGAVARALQPVGQCLAQRLLGLRVLPVVLGADAV
jgi:hypothetical protein